MNAQTFDSHSANCPICSGTKGTKSRNMVSGLLTCKHCRERLVVSWSGHYVRDPFTLKQLTVGRTLRRQSRPLARILRDFRFARYAPLLIAIAGGAVFLGLNAENLENWGVRQLPWEKVPEWISTDAFTDINAFADVEKSEPPTEE